MILLSSNPFNCLVLHLFSIIGYIGIDLYIKKNNFSFCNSQSEFYILFAYEILTSSKPSLSLRGRGWKGVKRENTPTMVRKGAWKD